MKEIEIWQIVKKFNLEEKFNLYDIYVFVLNHIEKLERLLKREINAIEIEGIIHQVLLFLDKR